MLIYIKTTPDTDQQLHRLSDELYSYMHADKGLTNFHYAFTPYDKEHYEEAFHRISFEIKGTEQQLAFLKMIDADFDILCVEPTEGGGTIEAAAMERWHQNHTDRPLPKKVTKPPVIFRLEKTKDGKSPLAEPEGLYGRYYYEARGNGILCVSNSYSSESYEKTKRQFPEITPDVYDKIASGFEEAPSNYEALKTLYDSFS
jgi:hypothetical protein